MLTADDRLALIRVKVERAKQHIRDLEVVRNRFFDNDPYRIETKNNPQTGQIIYTIRDLKTPPLEIALIAGDAIHNLRTALDHLAFQLVRVNNGTPTKQTAFPFWDSASEYQAQRHRRVQGMSQLAIDAIDVTYPHKGGNELLWSVHYLDIADKHHALLLAFVSVRSVLFDIPHHLWRDRKAIGGFRLPSGLGDPLKDGDIILVREPDMHYEPEFAIDIAFAEPEIVKGHPLLKILQHLSDLVDNLVVSFKSLLS